MGAHPDIPEQDNAARRGFLHGMRDGLPFMVIGFPFGLVFGVVATEAGLTPAQTMGFSAGVLGGASQFAALQMMAESAPVVIVILTAIMVNLRMAMYSASLAPHLADVPLWKRVVTCHLLLDQSYAVSILRFEQGRPMPPEARLTYFAGTALPMVATWLAGSWAGATLGTAVPPGLPLDFAVPITFLALIGPMLRSAAHVAAAFVSVALALLLAWMPWNLGLLIAAIAAMVTGAQIEAWTLRSAARHRDDAR